MRSAIVERRLTVKGNSTEHPWCEAHYSPDDDYIFLRILVGTQTVRLALTFEEMTELRSAIECGLIDYHKAHAPPKKRRRK
jgi:hypothetical protein